MPRSTLLLGSCILIGSVTLAWYWQRPHSDEPVVPRPEPRPVSYTHLDVYKRQRQAIPDFESPISPDELAGLALEEEVESRLVLSLIHI